MKRRFRRFELWKWLCYYTKNFFYEYKYPMLFSGCFACAGLIIGIIVSSQNPEYFYKGDFIYLMKLQEYSIFGDYFKYAFLALISLFLIFLNAFSSYLKCVSLFVIAYNGFRLGCLIVSSIVNSIFSGIICTIFFYIPIMVVTLCVLSVAYCLINRYNCGKYYRDNAYCPKTMKEICKKIGFLFCVILINNIVFVLIIPSIIKFIIVF